MKQTTRKEILSFFLINFLILAPICIFFYVQAGDKIAVLLKLPNMNNEVDKIRYSQTLIQNKLYQASDIQIFEKIFEKKDINSFSTKKTGFHYVVGNENGRLNVRINDFSSQQCKSFVSSAVSNEKWTIKVNGTKIKKMSWSQFNNICSSEKNTLSVLI